MTFEKSPEFISLIPAPNWRAYFYEWDKDEVKFFEASVIGWAIVRRFYEEADHELCGEHDDAVELIVFNDREELPGPISTKDEFGHFEYSLIPPGESFDDARQDELRKRAIRIRAREHEAMKAAAGKRSADSTKS